MGAMDVMDGRVWMRVSETSRMLGFSKAKVYDMVARGELPSVRVDGSVRVDVDGLRAWVIRKLEESR
jgi:excisionase family DNA binding protein